MIRQFKTGVLFLILVILSSHALAEGTCDATEESSKRRNERNAILRSHKVCAIPTIMIVSIISSCIPILSNEVMELRAGTNGYTVIKTFVGTAILATGLTLVLPDVFQSFSWDDNNDDIFTFELYAMISTVLILLVDSFAWSVYMSTSPLILTLVVFYMFIIRDLSTVIKLMPLLAMVHSLIIGISTGLSTNLSTAKLLLTALTFHQHCEGIGVGELIVKLSQDFRSWPKKMLLYSTLLAAPIGVGIGIGISTIFNDHQENGLKELFDLASVLMLTGRAVVDLAALTYVTRSRVVLLFGAILLMLLGAGCMILMAIWA